MGGHVVNSMYGAFPSTGDFLASDGFNRRKNDAVELVVCDPGGGTGHEVKSMYGAFPNSIDFLAPRKNDSVELVVCEPGGDTGGKVVSMYGALPNTDDFLATRDGIETIVNDVGDETLATWTVFDDAHTVLPNGNRLIGRKFVEVSELDSRRLIGSKFATNHLCGSDGGDETEVIGMEWGEEFGDADEGFSHMVECLLHKLGGVGNCEDLKLTGEELIENWVVEDSGGGGGGASDKALVGSDKDCTCGGSGGVALDVALVGSDDDVHASLTGEGGRGGVSSVNCDSWDDGGYKHTGCVESRESLTLSLSSCYVHNSNMDDQMRHLVPLVACT